MTPNSDQIPEALYDRVDNTDMNEFRLKLLEASQETTDAD